MAASATPRPKPPAADPRPKAAAVDIVESLAARDPVLPLAVACSGGADSIALLHAAHRVWPGRVHAIHVHHGLQAAADAFEVHVRQACHRLGASFHGVRVDARHGPGESPEDAARRARYAALEQVAIEQGLRTVWLAQHADDQVETLLLALSRGAGLPGLAGMAPRFQGADGAVWFERPWLKVPAPALRNWLREHGIAWVEDPMNADPAYTRTRIRNGLLPSLEDAFPSFRETVLRSMRHVAQAQQLLTDLARQDLQSMDGEPRIAALQALPRERQANLLRHWLRSANGTAASAAQMEELLDQIDACRTRGHGLRIRVGAGFVRREGDRLTYAATGYTSSV